jgi:hypothetical protein
MQKSHSTQHPAVHSLNSCDGLAGQPGVFAVVSSGSTSWCCRIIENDSSHSCVLQPLAFVETIAVYSGRWRPSSPPRDWLEHQRWPPGTWRSSPTRRTSTTPRPSSPPTPLNLWVSFCDFYGAVCLSLSACSPSLRERGAFNVGLACISTIQLRFHTWTLRRHEAISLSASVERLAWLSYLARSMAWTTSTAGAAQVQFPSLD